MIFRIALLQVLWNERLSVYQLENLGAAAALKNYRFTKARSGCRSGPDYISQSRLVQVFCNEVSLAHDMSASVAHDMSAFSSER